MPDHQPLTTLERVAYLEQLVHLALEDFESSEHGVLWDALIDARAALSSAHAVVTAVHLDGLEVPVPALVCTACGDSADDRLDTIAHHVFGECASRSSNGTVTA